MILNRYLFLSFFLILTDFCFSQSKVISLREAIQLAQKSSLDYKIAENITWSNYWDNQALKSAFLPKLFLAATIPEYFHSITRITLPTGEYDFVHQDAATSSLRVGLSQNIGFTGGRISMSSSLDRLDNFGTLKRTAYSSVPLSFNYYQSSFLYNDFKWQKKIQALRNEESKRDYMERLEEIANTTVSKYFDLLQAEMQCKLDVQNYRNIDTLVKITTSRYEIGTVQLNDLLQAKVSLLNAKKSIANSQLSLNLAKQSFIRFLNLDTKQPLTLEMPKDIKDFEIKVDQAIALAKNNRKAFIEFQRRSLEARQAVAKVKSSTGPQFTFSTNIGFTQRGNTFNQAYNQLLNNQTVVCGISVPLIDWGVNKSNRKRAEANLDLEGITINQQTLSLEQEITVQILRWNMQKEQTEIGKEASELANQRYNIAKQKYSLGSITFTDFNNAQMDKDRAVTDYVNNLRSYWTIYFLVRKLTHYDFEKNAILTLQDIVPD